MFTSTGSNAHTVSLLPRDILNVFKMEEHSNGELSQWTILINLLLLVEGFYFLVLPFLYLCHLLVKVFFMIFQVCIYGATRLSSCS